MSNPSSFPRISMSIPGFRISGRTPITWRALGTITLRVAGWFLSTNLSSWLDTEFTSIQRRIGVTCLDGGECGHHQTQIVRRALAHSPHFRHSSPKKSPNRLEESSNRSA